MVKFYAMASVQETKQCWSEEDDFQLEKPKLDVQVRWISPSFYCFRICDGFLLMIWLKSIGMNLDRPVEHPKLVKTVS